MILRTHQFRPMASFPRTPNQNFCLRGRVEMKCILAWVLVLCLTTRTAATPFCSDSSREFEERDSCPSGRYYTSDEKFDIRHHCDGSSDNLHCPADSVDRMQCDYQETGWTECLPLELIGGADKADYIYNSSNPENIYDSFMCEPQIPKSPSETKVFLGVPEAGEEQSDCLIEIPDVYVAAEVYLNVGSEEKQNCCCRLRLDMYLIWAEQASQGVPKSDSERNTTFHYFPVRIAYNHKIGRFLWPPNSCTEKKVYSIDNGTDATLGLKAVLDPSSLNLCQALARAKEDLESIYWFRFGFTVVVAVNQYCYKGHNLTKICEDSQLDGCIQNNPQVVTTLAATQFFYTRTVSLDGANITALDPGYLSYQAVEECHLACLRQYATKECDLISAGPNIDLDLLMWCKERVDVAHLGPLSPHWWNSNKCLQPQL